MGQLSLLLNNSDCSELAEFDQSRGAGGSRSALECLSRKAQPPPGESELACLIMDQKKMPKEAFLLAVWVHFG